MGKKKSAKGHEEDLYPQLLAAQPPPSLDLGAADDTEGIGARGRQLLAAISEDVRRSHVGEFAAVDVDTGKVYYSRSDVDVARLARTAHPKARLFIARIGSDATYERSTP